jgi:deazaflavin-dependent oxidoreductase (nitroreductase family)
MTAPANDDAARRREVHRLDAADRLRPILLLARPVEVAQIRLLGRSAVSLLVRTPVLVLHTTGRRSGEARATPLAYLADPGRAVGDAPRRGSLLVVGGAGGQVQVPDWVANLRADPTGAVTLHRRRYAVRVDELGGDERAAVWPKLAARWPRIEGYQRRAGRPIPVFRLTPI